MQNLLVDRAISMSDFKKNPAAVLRQADGRPVAVLNHNRVSFYLLEPRLLERLLQELAGCMNATAGNAVAGPAKTPRQLFEDFLSQAKVPGPHDSGQ
jgi:PHD/YefM family antitoxin component YafN of YafNO toxin-antitoxin module